MLCLSDKGVSPALETKTGVPSGQVFLRTTGRVETTVKQWFCSLYKRFEARTEMIDGGQFSKSNICDALLSSYKHANGNCAGYTVLGARLRAAQQGNLADIFCHQSHRLMRLQLVKILNG